MAGCWHPFKTARAALAVAIGTTWWKMAMATPCAQRRKKTKEEANAGILHEIQAATKAAALVTEECGILYDQREAVRMRKKAWSHA